MKFLQASLIPALCVAFQPSLLQRTRRRRSASGVGRTFPSSSCRHPFSLLLSSASSSATTTKIPSQGEQLRSSVNELKRVLEREYTSFFNPMERDWYSPTVTFDDPLTSLAGVDRYQANVDMLASRTLLGEFLFSDAGIVLHSVTGGSIIEEEEEDRMVTVEDIVTQWTLRLTAKILPWQPTARFSGISVYQVAAGGPKGVQIVRQTDYWDSINLKSDGRYQTVDKGTALSDFLSQLKPSNFIAPPAGPELPYNLLRRGRGYEVRRYPAFVAVETPYERRDEGFLTLGSITSGLKPLSPAILTVNAGSPKTMAWPLAFAAPGTNDCDAPAQLLERLDEYEGAVQVTRFPERVVAVGTFSQASVEPVVRRADRELREACQRDGLIVTTTPTVASSSSLQFAQYDAVYTMGKRRGEVWIELKEGSHPWSSQ